MGLCKYCNQYEAIENSHVIPSFMFQWMKKTSASPNGFMRSSHEPNIRQQDGLKCALLCNNCEVNFSRFEDEFKKNIFNRTANYRKEHPTEMIISDSSKKLINILAWRTLAYIYFFHKDHQYTEEEFNEFPIFLNKIKSYIDDNVQNNFRIHYIPCTKDVLTKLGLPQVNWIYYDRFISSEPRIWDNWERFIIFIKIPFGIISFELVSHDGDEWTGTRIDNKDKLTLSEIESTPEYIKALVSHYVEEFSKAQNQLSDNQRKIIESSATSLDSGFFKSLYKEW